MQGGTKERKRIDFSAIVRNGWRKKAKRIAPEPIEITATPGDFWNPTFIENATTEIDNTFYKLTGGNMWTDILKTVLKVLPIGLILKVLLLELKEYVEKTDNDFDDAAYIVIRTIFEKVGWIDEGDPELKTDRDTALGK